MIRWLLLVWGVCSAATAAERGICYQHWTVTGPILSHGAPGSFDEVAVKDPSIVNFGGRYHVFYTSKAALRRDTSLGYTSAPTLEGLATSPRIDMRKLLGERVIAPQVFYFQPQKLWYLIGHRDVANGKLHRLEPVYLTNPDIQNVQGWSKPRAIETGRQARGDFWIDFWVICDERHAHLFYTNHVDAMYRLECPIEQFPQGFAAAKEQLALRAQGRNEVGAWTLHEASHIYRVKSDGRYLALLEGTYAHPTRPRYWDSRNRFMFAMIADRLEGPWHRVEASDGEFLGDGRRLFRPDGSRSPLGQVSHPELLRAGYDQRLEIDDYRLAFLFQAFDASHTPDNYDYDKLPWSLYLMRCVQ